VPSTTVSFATVNWPGSVSRMVIGPSAERPWSNWMRVGGLDQLVDPDLAIAVRIETRAGGRGIIRERDLHPCDELVDRDDPVPRAIAHAVCRRRARRKRPGREQPEDEDGRLGNCSRHRPQAATV
jgi:hypothetical protein